MIHVPEAQHRLRELADASELELFRQVSSSPNGLSEAEAVARLGRYGENRFPVESEDRAVDRMLGALRSPFVGLLAALGVVFVALGDPRGASTVTVMVLLSVAVRVWLQGRSRRAIDALRNRVIVTSTVRRRADIGHRPCEREVPSHDVVPGDVVVLRPGDLVPADVRLLRTQHLAVDQATLSGEAMPVPKAVPGGRHIGVVDAPTLCFAGTSVVSGSATAVVIATGQQTYLGSLVAQLTDRVESGFDRGVRSVGWTLVQFMLVLTPIVLLVNWTVTGDWTRAVMFAVAVAVGLTPEMLPVIVTANLARGAVRLAERKVLVKRLNAIQDLGAADVLCVDKTGTLTEDRVAYSHSIDPDGRPDGQAAEYAYVALLSQVGPLDRLDQAIVDQLGASPEQLDADHLLIDGCYRHVDEIGFDPHRRRATVVVRPTPNEHLLITKGDPDVVLARCLHQSALGASTELLDGDRSRIRDMVAAHGKHGMRILAVAVKYVPARLGDYGEADESGLTLVGFIGFVDPVGAGVADAVRALDRHGVDVKILTGDHEHVTRHLCDQAGMDVGDIVLGEQVERATDRGLAALVDRTRVFARLAPEHKTRIVASLQSNGHMVGFVGDGVNDAPALRLADVGIAAHSATEVAKDAADLVLLDKDLGVIAAGVLEGRRTLGNTLKYVHITASSNFGNVLTVLVASLLLPVLPVLPIQLVVQNLLYDAAQLALPWDRVEPGYLARPRRWDSAGLTRFMLVFGPLSSLFDLVTFTVLYRVFGAGTDQSLLRTGWFVEGLCSQLLVVFVLRAPVPAWRAARARWPVALAAGLAALVGLLLPWSPLAALLGMRPIPGAYLIWLAAVLLSYGLSTELLKRCYARRHPDAAAGAVSGRQGGES